MQTAARLALLCIVLCLGVIPAYAADQGDCGTPEAMTAKFKAEGQHTFATADQQVRENVATGETLDRLYAILITVNDDLSVGYVLKSDKDSGVRASKICVYQRLAALRLFDARKAGTPPGALLKASDKAAKARCAELIKSGKLEDKTCAPLNYVIGKGEPNGERVMLQGFNVDKQPDGSYKNDGTLTTVTGNVNGTLHDDPNEPVRGVAGGLFYSSLPDGATIINMALMFAHYTPYAIAMLDPATNR